MENSIYLIMKVLIIPSWYPTKENPINGVFFKEQAEALVKKSIEVTVLYVEVLSLRHYKRNKKFSHFENSIINGVETIHIRKISFIPKFAYFIKLLRNFTYRRFVKKYIQQKGKPDVLHAHSCLYGGVVASKIGFREKIPLVITEHSTRFSRELLTLDESQEIKKALNIASKVIAVGPGLKSELSKFVDEKKIVIIPNLIDTNRFVPMKIKKVDRRDFIFFSLGLLTKKKGMDILIRAFSKIYLSNVFLYIGGSGEEEQNLTNLIHSLNLNDKVNLLGNLNRDQVNQWLNQSDCFVLASLHETFGVVYIEALATGTPIIATKTGGPDLTVKDFNGLLVSPNNITELTEAMIKMVENFNQYDPSVIRNDCIERFSEDVIIDEIKKVYSEVIEINQE